MSLENLVPLAWTCWGILFCTVLVASVMIALDKRSSPEVGPGFDFLVILLLCFLIASAGGFLYYFTKSESVGGVLTMAVVHGFVVFVLVADPCVMAYQRWSFERDYNRVGQFKQPELVPLADAIREGDSATLTRLLDGKPPPLGLDRTGHDLLCYSLEMFRSRKGSLDCVRALLEAGSDPNSARMPDGKAPIHFMIVDIKPSGREGMVLLLEYGADPNLPDPISGDTVIHASGDSPHLVRSLVAAGAEIDRIQSDGLTALVEFVAHRQWESAIYLVEQGARLDVAREDGLSIDYYLKDWKDSVFGEHPEGWDRLREAITAKRERGR